MQTVLLGCCLLLFVLLWGLTDNADSGAENLLDMCKLEILLSTISLSLSLSLSLSVSLSLSQGLAVKQVLNVPKLQNL